MDIESIKEQIIDRFFEIKGKVEDSELYIGLKDRYDNLSPNAQIGVKIAASLMTLFVLYSFPAGYLTTANEKIEMFEENRQLTRDLIRAGRIASTIQLPPMAPTIDSLTSQINSAIDNEHVLAEQKGGVIAKQDVVQKSIVPKAISQTGVKAILKKLNLRQLVNLGESLEQIQGSKLINIAVLADSSDPHYFDVDYEVAAFSMPMPKEEVPQNKNSRFRKQRGTNN